MDGRVERSSQVALRIGAVLAAVCVVLPASGLAAVLAFLASQETLIGHPVAVEDRQRFLLGALLAVGFVIVVATALRGSLRRGFIALLVVGLGGLACAYAGVRGIIEATGVDNLITVWSWGVAATGIVLLLGASLGLVARARATHRTVT